MAYIVPSDVKKLEFTQGNAHELETLAFLQKNLSNEYTVFHGVHWSREYQSWTHFGEIDFVILHKHGGVLFIEQKNGALDESKGALVKHYGESSKDVADQIHRSIDKVREKYQWTNGKKHRLVVDYLIYCPDYQIKMINAVGISAERIVDATKRHQLAEVIHSLCTASNQDAMNYSQIENFFRQTFELVPDIHAHKEKLNKSFIRQSGSLVSVLANLEMKPFRLRIVATAGSGKSLLVHSFMEKEAHKGKRILFLCFNRLLAEKRQILWQGKNDDNSLIKTFYGFCSEFLLSKGVTLDYTKMFEQPEIFWPDVLEKVMAMDIEDSWLFDTLIIDEGQDFQEDWYEIAKLFLKENASILWLEDNEQKLIPTKDIKLDNFVTYRSNINYRTPESIARYILNELPTQFEIGNPLPGLGVDEHEYHDEQEQLKKVANIVQNLTRLGFKQEDIYIVSCKGAKKSIFSQHTKIGNYKLSHFTGKYDELGQQIMTEGLLRFDSIYRFKGLESPAIILVDIDFDKELTTQQQHLLFCGMTRATVKLDLLKKITKIT